MSFASKMSKSYRRSANTPRLLVCYCIALLCGVQFVCAAAHKTYYDVIGVRRDVTAHQLRKAYYARALQLHPDKRGNEPRKQDKFIELQEAYGVLKRPEKRKAYDATIAATSDWHFDGRNWEFRAAPGSSVDLAEAMRTLRRHQEEQRAHEEQSKLREQRAHEEQSKLREQRAQGVQEERRVLFATPHSRVKRLAPHRIPGVGKHAHTKYAWLILACTARRANCRKHEAVLDALGDRLRDAGVSSVRIGFLDCGLQTSETDPTSVCTTRLGVQKVSLVAVKRHGSPPTTIRINNKAPLKLNSLYEYALQVLRYDSNS